MLMKWIQSLFPRHQEKKKELDQSSRRVALTILRYRESSKEIQAEIERNKFSKYLVYDRGDHHGGH
ncbi:hypothetical protein [Paenibacillus donghaensis]|uniref:Uncharacterized protein n=1 Tax=Paenibacillus donghaensis TaxID=414771 RepID=A0A2Z2KD45_9BACL|nr:hypothetical protein [Paenibacillus donghaensis]ASA20960.1 hypothetical protein B9T62_09280 [Paenibacillus donghaensis]